MSLDKKKVEEETQSGKSLKRGKPLGGSTWRKKSKSEEPQG